MRISSNLIANRLPPLHKATSQSDKRISFLTSECCVQLHRYVMCFRYLWISSTVLYNNQGKSQEHKKCLSKEEKCTMANVKYTPM